MRDYQIMVNKTSTDSIFNFFVTAYHIMDYVRALETIPEDDITEIYESNDFKRCQYICNKGKHFKLRKKQPYGIIHRLKIIAAPLGSFVLGYDQLVGKEQFVIFDNDEELDVIELGNKVIKLWGDFLKDHEI